MRIAVQSYFRRKVAGAEIYLDSVLPALAKGNELALLVDREGPTDRELLRLPEGTPVWSAERAGPAQVARELRAWRPDLIYSHGTADHRLEAHALELAPAVFMAHSYYGTCISGTKTCRKPVAAPCQRTFGPACLLHYFPRRCGGRNPLTMLRLYRDQRRRLRRLFEYRAVLTLSEHMRQEFLRHGLDPNRVVKLPPPGFDGAAPLGRVNLPLTDRPRRLLFLGRADFLKGGHLLIEALPRVADTLGPVHLTVAGDGPELPRWKDLGARVAAANPCLEIDFAGWVGDMEKEALLARAELLVVPSIWPEPFGMVGREAARAGVPAVAFDVGGIREWLVDGRTGCLAPANPPTSTGLADAIIRCLGDAKLTHRFGDEARRAAATVSHADHVAALQRVFEQVTGHT